MTFPSLSRDPRVIAAILDRWGAPYGWAEGSPATADDPGSLRDDSDCSGMAQEVLVIAGELDPGEIDRNAYNLAMVCDPIPRGKEQPFDLAFYGVGGKITHVMVVVGPGAVLGASGGGSRTHGDDPRAAVWLSRMDYRSDFVCIGRMKAAHRPRPS